MRRSVLVIGIVLLVVSSVPALSGTVPNWPTPSSWAPAPAGAGGGGIRSALATAFSPVPFIPIDPCRIIDTRSASGFPAAYGPPSLPGAHAQRTFFIVGQCGIPTGAVAVSFNFTVWAPVTRGDIRVFPAGTATPTVATLNWEAGILALANAAVAPLSFGGSITVQVDGPGTIDLIVDVNGYYSDLVPVSTPFSISTNGFYAIKGMSSASTGHGVAGISTGTSGIGVAGSGNGMGVYGQSISGIGVGGSSSNSVGVEGGSITNIGVVGTSSAGWGVKGTAADHNGVWAESTNNDGLYATGGRDGILVQGIRHGVNASSTGTIGALWGVNGSSASPVDGSAGVRGVDSSGAPDGWATLPRAGVVGGSKAGTAGVLGISQIGSAVGVRGVKLLDTSPYSVLADAQLAPVAGSAAKLYGNVDVLALLSVAPGDLNVAGTVTKGLGSFKIDHPLDPENRYLYHSFVESPDMKNVYDGVVELGPDGSAVVKLPPYFQALNKDFRYQITALGTPQPKLHVASKVANNEFLIGGGEPYAEVSWQVTGIRKDPLANSRRIIPEVEKEPDAKGYYLHPAEYGQGPDKYLGARLAEAEKAREAERAKRPSQQ